VAPAVVDPPRRLVVGVKPWTWYDKCAPNPLKLIQQHQNHDQCMIVWFYPRCVFHLFSHHTHGFHGFAAKKFPAVKWLQNLFLINMNTNSTSAPEKGFVAQTVYSIGLLAFQLAIFPSLMSHFLFKSWLQILQFAIGTLFHIVVFVNSPIRMLRILKLLFQPEEVVRPVLSTSSSEFSFDPPEPILSQIADKLNLNRLMTLCQQLFNDFVQLPLFSHYLYDRYIVHSPVCVVKKLAGNDETKYSFNGIALTNLDGFSDYIMLSKMEHSTPVSSKPPTLPKRRKLPSKITKLPPNNNVNKLSRSLRQNRSKEASMSKLVQAATQVSEILENDPNTNVLAKKPLHETDEVFPEYPRGTLSKKLKQRLSSIPKENSVHSFRPKRKLSTSSNENDNLGLLKQPANPWKEPELAVVSSEPLSAPADPEPLLVRKKPSFSSRWNRIAQSTTMQNKISIPSKFDPSQIIDGSKGKVRYINIELPNKLKTSLKLKIVPKDTTNSKSEKILEIVGNTLVTKSINQDEVEYINEIKEEIKRVLPRSNYDDGSLGPIIVRLAWHCCATYDKYTGIGGSNGATMRFMPEITDEGNTGLDIARAALEPVKQKFPRITYSDLWTLAGKVAIEEMGGPVIPWRCGRVDCVSDTFVPENGNLPFGDKDANHIRTTFNRMGFNDRETVALLGCHGLGRCHKRFSGWEGKWTTQPTTFSNEFFHVLVNENWQPGLVPETGKIQYYNNDKSLMMLNTDMELLNDVSYRRFVEIYSVHESVFFADFAQSFGKLLELGIERDASGAVQPREKY